MREDYPQSPAAADAIGYGANIRAYIELVKQNIHCKFYFTTIYGVDFVAAEELLSMYSRFNKLINTYIHTRLPVPYEDDNRRTQIATFYEIFEMLERREKCGADVDKRLDEIKSLSTTIMIEYYTGKPIDSEE